MYADDRQRYGPWFGPMSGVDIAMFERLDGAGDTGSLIGGNDNAEGYVYQCNEGGIYADNASAIDMIWQSAHEVYADPALDVRVMQSEMEMTNPSSTVTLSLHDTHSSIGTATSISPETAGVYWGDSYWGDDNWNDSGTPTRRNAEHFEQTLIGRMLSTKIQYSGTDAFSFFSLTHEAKPIEQTFQYRP